MIFTFICPKGHRIESEMERYFKKKLVWCPYCFELIDKKKCEVKDVKIDEKEIFGESIAFFKAEDMKTQEIIITIKDVRMAELPQTGKTIIVDFIYNKEDRSIPLNKTNFKMLKEKFGLETEEWNNKRITLYKVKVNNPTTNEEVDSIRIKK